MASHIGKLPVTIPAGVEVKIDGQSFTAKGEIINQVLAGNADIIIIDTEREYSPLVRALVGEIIIISVDISLIRLSCVFIFIINEIDIVFMKKIENPIQLFLCQ